MIKANPPPPQSGLNINGFLSPDIIQVIAKTLCICAKNERNRLTIAKNRAWVHKTHIAYSNKVLENLSTLALGTRIGAHFIVLGLRILSGW